MIFISFDNCLSNLKKLFAILLAAVLLFNWYGYQPFTHWLEAKADAQMVTQLNEQQYDDAALITIEVPLNLPYTTNWPNFERVDGTIEHNGQHYNFVKRKLVNGIMIYKCIPNLQKDEITNSREQFFKLAYDLQKLADTKKQTGKKPLVLKKGIDDFTNNNFKIEIATIKQLATVSATTIYNISKGFGNNQYQPPQA
jgi:hypothetical protein